MAYTFVCQSAAEAALRKLPKEIQVRILRKVDQLAEHPFSASTEKLRAASNLWRIRIGGYRIVYTVERKELVVLILKIGHRREVIGSPLLANLSFLLLPNSRCTARSLEV
jgi:mRNA interferase RelE/StbE